MCADPPTHDYAAIRGLLFGRFCLDRPTFRPIVDRFGPGHGHVVRYPSR
jgi:hypothetical protein